MSTPGTRPGESLSTLGQVDPINYFFLVVRISAIIAFIQIIQLASLLHQHTILPPNLQNKKFSINVADRGCSSAASI